MALLSPYQDVIQANSFCNAVSSNAVNYFLFVGHPGSWANDSAPPALSNNLLTIEQNIYHDMLFGKILANTDISQMITRYNWIANTVYAQYDPSTAGLYDTPFYVVTDQLQVYKCLYNNGGAPSTVKPSSSPTSGSFTTGDGYVWKYIYTVDSTAHSKFSSNTSGGVNGFVPVATNANVAGNTIPGTIDVIKITNGGAGYNIYETGSIAQVIDNYNIQLPNTSSGLNGYYTNSSIYFTSGSGAGQVRQIVAYNGNTRIATVNQAITTYATLNLANVLGTVASGYQAVQPIDSIPYYAFDTGFNQIGNAQRYFNPGDTIVQADSGYVGTILAVNSTVIQVFNNNQAIKLANNLPIRDTSGTQTSMTGTANVTTYGSLTYSTMANNGSGYTSNPAVTVTANTLDSPTTLATVYGYANTTGKVTSILVTAAGNGYYNQATFAIAAPANTSFNANTSVDNVNNTIAISSAQYFVANDVVYYYVASGNTPLSGLTSGTQYYVQFANQTNIALTNSPGGSKITLTKGVTESGHALQGATASGVMLPDTYCVKGSGTATFTSFASNNYIGFGSNANANFRKVSSVVNNTLLIVTAPFLNTFTNAIYYDVGAAALPSPATTNTAYGYVSNTNLSGYLVTINNLLYPSLNFYPGEQVNLLSNTGNPLANGYVAFSNSTTLLLSYVSSNSAWNISNQGDTVAGISSGQTANVIGAASNPSITLTNPVGQFINGLPVYFTTGNTFTGNSKLISYVLEPNQSTAYQVGPTIQITGDGSNAAAIAVVNTALGSGNAISRIAVINPGIGYSNASIQIVANAQYGSGATGTPIVSPTSGHGFDAPIELGGRYVCVDKIIDTATVENYYFPVSGNVRSVGVICNPSFSNVVFTVPNTSVSGITANVTYANVSYHPNSSHYITTTFFPGETVFQQGSYTYGTVQDTSLALSSNTIQVTFINGGNLVTGNTIYGLFSNTTANVIGITYPSFNAGDTLQLTQGTEPNVYGNPNIVVGSGKITSVIPYANNAAITRLQVDGLTGIFGGSFTSILDANTNARAYGVGYTTPFFGGDYGAFSANISYSQFSQMGGAVLTTSSGNFQIGEYVYQPSTNATGRVFSVDLSLGLNITGGTGSPPYVRAGQTLTDTSTTANAVVIFANNVFARLGAVPANASFNIGDTFSTGPGYGSISNTYVTLGLSDVNGVFAPNAAIIGQVSGAVGTTRSVRNPDLTKNSGRVIYYDQFQPLQLSPTSREEFKLIIKF